VAAGLLLLKHTADTFANACLVLRWRVLLRAGCCLLTLFRLLMTAVNVAILSANTFLQFTAPEPSGHACLFLSLY